MFIMRRHLTGILAALWLGGAATASAAEVNLSALDLSSMSSGWGTPRADQSITEGPLSIGGTVYETGIGTHAVSEFMIRLDGKADEFTVAVGVDDRASNPATASVAFHVFGDGTELWQSGICRHGEAARVCRVDLSGVRFLELAVTDAGDGVDSDHADWTEPKIVFHGTAPVPGPPPAPKEEFRILTPPAPRAPRINGPRVTGLRPGSPMLFRIPCTGVRPITFSASGLPEGIRLDSATGILTGTTREVGTHRLDLTAKNRHGSDERELRLMVGDQLALTPPMGWNSWYIHYNRVSQQHLKRAAEAMIASGMADHGYQYVNIDDCWMKKRGDEPYRDDDGDLLTNDKFPDIEAMVDYIHSFGLRAGTYISPGPWTCAGYVGSWQHEAQDAAWFARVGFDFLKYDWCSYSDVATGEGRERLIRPYRIMWNQLKQQPRDIVLNLCQYGMGSVWEWGGSVGHSWRTTGDLGLQRGGGLPGFYAIGMSNARHWQYAEPGSWNDPDYLLIGWVGDARGMKEGQPTDLTPNEQYSYMSMWSLMAAPLVFSGDMEKLDPFTLNILCNPEIIDINQDPLGRQARIVRQSRHDFILAKPLEDGSIAVGIFNLAPYPREMNIELADLGLAGPLTARDPWRQQDLEPVAKTITATIPSHGVYLVQLQTP